MKKKLFYMMILSGLGFAISTAWLISELWVSITIKNFDTKTLPTFAIALSIYGLLHVLYYGKSKYKLHPVSKTHGVGKDSQTPVRL